MPRLSPFRLLARAALRTSTPATLTPVAAPIATTSIASTSSTLSSALRTSTPLLRGTPNPTTSLFTSTKSPVLSLLGSNTNGSAAMAMGGMGMGEQVRTVTYGSEYQPSQRIRKRRHGFLARIKTRNGRKTIMRRRFRGKAKLSH